MLIKDFFFQRKSGFISDIKSKIPKWFSKSRPWTVKSSRLCHKPFNLLHKQTEMQNPHYSLTAKNKNIWAANTRDMHMYKAWAFLCGICRACGETLTHCWASILAWSQIGTAGSIKCTNKGTWETSRYMKATPYIRLWCSVALVCCHVPYQWGRQPLQM